MSKHKPQTTKPDEVQLLKSQLNRITNEYQILFQQANGLKELVYKNALGASNLARGITSKLLDIETTDKKVSGQILAIIKDLNKVETPKKEETVVTQETAEKKDA